MPRHRILRPRSCADMAFAPVRGGGTPERIRGRDGIAGNGIIYHSVQAGQHLSVTRHRRLGVALVSDGHPAVSGEAKKPSKAMKNRPKKGDKSSTGSCPLFGKLMLIISNLRKSGLMKKLCLIAGVLPPPSGHDAPGRTRSMFLGCFAS